MSGVARLRTLLVTVLATIAVASTAAFGMTTSAATAPSFAGKGAGPLRAGAAEGLIRVPVGAPLGGYLRPPVGGDFVGPDPQAEATDALPTQSADDGAPLAPLPDEARKASSPYATYSPPSRGYYDALTAKAVALDDGEDVAVLLKTDLIGALDEVTVAVAEQVKTRTGVDVAEGLVLSATHTHDGPGAVANDSVRYFWLAMDAYQPELFERLVGDLADVVVEALNKRVPARFGFATGQESRGASLNSFRRSRSPWTPERVALQDMLRRRIGVLQVDEVDASGAAVRPLAIVTNYAAHGIVFGVENTYFSGDALAAAEREIEASFDEPMVAMFVQNTGGDVSPRADGKPSLQRIERFGKLLAPQVLGIARGIGNFDAQPDIKAASQRIRLNRKALGYAEGEYPYEYGAVQCNAQAQLPERCLPAPPPGQADLADNGAAENDSFVPLDTLVTALRIGDAVLLAQPGEPLAEYGLRILEASPFGVDRTFIWGYSQDHIGYLMPDSKADWMLGGTEGTTTFWGWKLGARLQRVNVELMDFLAGTTAQAPRDELAVAYSKRPYAPAQPTPSPRPARIVSQPKAIERFGTTTFRFEGGDPVVDLPTVTLQREVGNGEFKAARRPNGRIINTPYEYHLDYELVSGAHQWTVTFEPNKDWKAGVYRFVARGVAAGAARTKYTATSAPFEVKPSDSLVVSPVTRSGDTVEATLAYTPRPANYRLIDAEVPADRAAPVRAGTVTFTAGDVEVTDATPDIETRDGLTIAVFRATVPGGGQASARGEDAWGNSTP